MEEGIAPFEDLILKVEEKLIEISPNLSPEVEDIIACKEILKKGKSIDSHILQKLISWLTSENSLKAC